MARYLIPHGERSISKPSRGFYGFRISDNQHLPNNKIVADAYLDAEFTAAKQKPEGKPWLSITLRETTETKAGSRSRAIALTLSRDEMEALRATINAVLE